MNDFFTALAAKLTFQVRLGKGRNDAHSFIVGGKLRRKTITGPSKDHFTVIIARMTRQRVKLTGKILSSAPGIAEKFSNGSQEMALFNDSSAAKIARKTMSQLLTGIEQTLLLL